MKKLLLIFVTAIAVLVSCSKDETTPVSDKFVGNYLGNVNYSAISKTTGATYSYSDLVKMKITKKNENEIFIDENTENEATARCSGNEFTLNDNQYVYFETDNGIKKVSYSGGGKITENNNLVIVFTLSNENATVEMTGIIEPVSE